LSASPLPSWSAVPSRSAARPPRAANGDRLIAEARAKQKEILLEAKDEAITLAKTAETENRERRAELQRYETRLDKKDEQLDQRLAAVDQRERRLVEKELELEAEREKIAQLQSEQQTELARVAGLSMDEARGLLLNASKTRCATSRTARSTTSSRRPAKQRTSVPARSSRWRCSGTRPSTPPSTP
jgi:predicted RNase H-like nuclease (RuvC/YqgF family)